jgi:hypothetical protein
MGRHQLNPRICNISLDANALDRDGSSRDPLVDRLSDLIANDTLNIVMTAGVRAEVGHPRTPAQVQGAVMPRIFNMRAGLNSNQTRDRQQVADILRGNALAETHAADASHVSEAAETGCAYFLTEDRRILAKRPQLYTVLPASLMIATLAEFFTIFEATEGQEANGV